MIEDIITITKSRDQKEKHLAIIHKENERLHKKLENFQNPSEGEKPKKIEYKPPTLVTRGKENKSQNVEKGKITKTEVRKTKKPISTTLMGLSGVGGESYSQQKSKVLKAKQSK